MLRWVLAMLLLFAGCRTTGPGESTLTECQDDKDNDNDGLEDCYDPGCQALAYCALALQSAPTIPPPPPPTMLGTPMTTLPLGGSGAPMTSGPDAGPDLDGGEELPPQQQPPVIEEPPPPCDGLCTATQSCSEDNECIDITAPTEGRFEMRVVSARVSARGAFGLCLDMDCSFPFDLSCRCAPDPLVRVLRVRQPPMEGADVEVIEIGRTVVVTNDTTPTFPDERFELDLEPGDALRFEVWDADPEVNTAQFVFECRPNLSELEPGLIGCSEFGIGAEGTVIAEVLEVR